MNSCKCTQSIWEYRQNKGVLIAAHRGTCGGNIIQNTFLAYENALQHGADMVEMDVILSTDGIFYAFHDGEESRVLNVEQDIRTMSSKEIESYPCINQLGNPINQRLERLDSILKRVAEKCFVNIDRSWFYWKEIIGYLDKLNMPNKILLKSPVNPELLQILEDSKSKVKYMPIVRSLEEWELVQKYNINLAAVEVIFDNLNSPLTQPDFIETLHKKQIVAWVNAITLDDKTAMSAFLDDNNAILNGYEENWGRLIDMGFDIIQTDWPALVNSFLRQRRK